MDGASATHHSAPAWFSEYGRAFQGDHRLAADRYYTGDVTMSIPGRHSESGRFLGREEVVRALDAVDAATDHTIGPRKLHHIDYVVDRIYVRVIMGASRLGRTLEWERMVVYELRGNRISAISCFDFDLQMVDDFFSIPGPRSERRP